MSSKTQAQPGMQSGDGTGGRPPPQHDDAKPSQRGDPAEGGQAPDQPRSRAAESAAAEGEPPGGGGGAGAGEQAASSAARGSGAPEGAATRGAPAAPPQDLHAKDATNAALQGKTLLILGAASPLGRAIAAQAAAAGACVLLAAQHPEDARRVCRSILRHRHMAKAEHRVLVCDHALDFRHAQRLGPLAAAIDELLGPRPLDILINAVPGWGGAEPLHRGYTEQGVSTRAQALVLGPFALMQLLCNRMVASKTRVVCITTSLHRLVSLDASAFLYRWGASSFAHASLATVALTKELQRQLGPQGVTACCVDPGLSREDACHAWLLSVPPYQQVAQLLLPPAAEGADAVLHAATASWGGAAGPEADQRVRLYAKGLMASPLLSSLDVSTPSPLALLAWPAAAAAAAAHAVLDYPLRLWGRAWPLEKLVATYSAASPQLVPAAAAASQGDEGGCLWDAAEQLLAKRAAHVSA